jgi:hypothetical protein
MAVQLLFGVLVFLAMGCKHARPTATSDTAYFGSSSNTPQTPPRPDSLELTVASPNLTEYEPKPEDREFLFQAPLGMRSTLVRGGRTFNGFHKNVYVDHYALGMLFGPGMVDHLHAQGIRTEVPCALAEGSKGTVFIVVMATTEHELARNPRAAIGTMANGGAFTLNNGLRVEIKDTMLAREALVIGKK